MHTEFVMPGAQSGGSEGSESVGSRRRRAGDSRKDGRLAAGIRLRQISAPQTKQGFALQAFRDLILHGDLKPGDWIRVDEWAQRLGVSPTPVRESLRQMEAQGLVRIHTHIGAQVRAYSVTDFSEVYRIRAALEALAVQLALEKMTPQQTKTFASELLELNRTLAELIRDGAHEAARAMNKDFHWRICEAAESETLLMILDSLWITYPFDTLQLVPGRAEEIAEEHADLIEAIGRRDSQRAANAMRHHLDTAATKLLESVRRGQVALFQEGDSMDDGSSPTLPSASSAYPLPVPESDPP
ncbi:MAG: FCD domain-containing protein [Dehalococcoidia bacterium]|nr:FCD domain-containing protein [Dehalococcoidia bacterium]